MWLTGLLQPDHMTLWRFYNEHRDAMKGIFHKTVRKAVDVGMVDFELQCVDGSKIAVASNDRMYDEAQLAKLRAKVDAEIVELEAQEKLESATAEARANLNRAKAKKQEKLDRIDESIEKARNIKENQKPGTASEPVVCPSDPTASLMKTRSGWQVAHNAQVMVDSKEQIIVAADVTQDNYDCDQLVPLLEQEEELLGRCGDVTCADNGYHAARNLVASQERTDLYIPDKSYQKEKQKKSFDYHHSKFVYDEETDTYECPEGRTLVFTRNSGPKTGTNGGREYRCNDCDGCPARHLCTKSKHGRIIKRKDVDPILRAHRAKMETDEARDFMKQRPHVVEAVFGIMKTCQGARRFLMRGIDKVRQEWHLLCASFNLRKLYKNWAREQSLASAS